MNVGVSNLPVNIPTVPPAEVEDIDRGGDEGERLPQILIYGDDLGFLEKSFASIERDVDWGGYGNFDLRYFTDIPSLQDRFESHVIPNPRLLVVLTYVLTKKNVNNCLDSFLGLLEAVSGDRDSLDFKKGVKKRMQEQESYDKELFPSGIPYDVAKHSYERTEEKSMVSRALVCAGMNRSVFKLNPQNHNVMLDRWGDIGKSIRAQFSNVGDFNFEFPANRMLIGTMIRDRMVDFGLGGDS